MGERKRRARAAGGTAPRRSRWHRAEAASWLDRGIGRGADGASRLTWRTVLWFLGGCLLLDIVLWAVFAFGLARCYGVLCLIG